MNTCLSIRCWLEMDLVLIFTAVITVMGLLALLFWRV